MSTYPGTLDSLTNPAAGDPRDNPSHAAQHADANDAIEAIQAELGTDPAGAAATVRARLDALAGWTEIVKPSNQTVTNSVTLVNDSALVFAGLAGEVYHVELLLVYSGSATTSDYYCRFALPAGSNGWDLISGDGINNTVQHTARRFAGVANTADVGFGTSTSHSPIWSAKIEMMVTLGANGNVQFMFANWAASSGLESTTRAGSVLRYRKLA